MPAAVATEIIPPTSPSATHRRASLKILSRNIDKVALGNLIFPTWYYSPYPDSVIHDHESSTVTVKLESNNHLGSVNKHEVRHAGKYNNSSGGAARGNDSINGVPKHTSTNFNHQYHNTIPNEKSILSMLHVCPYCFRYTSSADDFAGHVALHVKAETEFYSRDLTLKNKRKSRRRRSNSNRSSDNEHEDDEDGAPQPVPESAVQVYSYEGYTVWDVDGEVEKLYCQNLSLFGKLFLEQKSVFFDTSGFHYFVLTYSPPSAITGQSSTITESPSKNKDHKPNSRSPQSTRTKRDSNITSATALPSSLTAIRKQRKSASATEPGLPTNSTHHGQANNPTLDQPSLPLRHQVLGFFSKENLSWDSNNLACILVFPPYQHRNLGQLLMAVSYKLSGWEWEDSIIGGPEKPLSTMGRKSYLRFWSERIARFIMGQSQDAEGLKVFEEGVMQEVESEDGTQQLIMTGKKRKRKHGKGLLKDEFSVKELGDRTGMLGEDVVAALVEMGVCDIVQSPKRKKQQKVAEGLSAGSASHPSTSTPRNNTNAATTSDLTGNSGTRSGDQHLMTMTVNRSKVLDWAKRNGVDMISSVKEEGFLGEWALSEEESGEEGEGNSDDEQGSDEQGDSD